MTRMVYTCELLTDVVLNQRAATSGNQQTLDFIPGNNFLGIVAGRLYGLLSEAQQLALFHNGAVRFGDAHPIGAGRMRSLRIPAAMFTPKGKKLTDICYIHHGYDRNKDNQKQQLKQCRSGFYVFQNGEGREVDVPRSFAIKSAYDSEKRRSEDERCTATNRSLKGCVSCLRWSVTTPTLPRELKMHWWANAASAAPARLSMAS